jgi:hypothetical protein
MPLIPLRKKVVGSLISQKDVQIGLIIDPFGSKKTQFAMKVEYVGPYCDEVAVGDVVILPGEGWTMVRLLEDDGTIVEKVSIEEDRILARVT